jgi:hypothetical protein
MKIVVAEWTFVAARLRPAGDSPATKFAMLRRRESHTMRLCMWHQSAGLPGMCFELPLEKKTYEFE